MPANDSFKEMISFDDPSGQLATFFRELI